ncbi:hypothetical protein HQ585_06525 [candidate division KSB1 bacterium]|nr:hypothetical protein [candidate division KSB1 bacterium]
MIFDKSEPELVSLDDFENHLMLNPLCIINLKPAKIRGVESNGMVLAVKSKDGLNLLTPDGEVDSGLRVS